MMSECSKTVTQRSSYAEFPTTTQPVSNAERLSSCRNVVTYVIESIKTVKRMWSNAVMKKN